MTVEDDIRSVFRDAGATGFLHVGEVGGETDAEIAVDADAPVVLASVFKIAVAVAFERAVSSGAVRSDERAIVTARYRRGGVGLAGLQDDVTMSWRDLAQLMGTISDNAATDLVFHRIGRGAVHAVLADLALDGTRIDGCCEDLIDGILDELGISRGAADIDEAIGEQPEERLWALAALDPGRALGVSTPRETTALLDAIWSDRAAPPDACARVRRTMAQQVWPHRLASGFPAGVRVAGKTGTLPAIRNEVGVVTYPDGREFAVSVFTRADSLAGSLPEVDRAIGASARLAIDALR